MATVVAAIPCDIENPRLKGFRQSVFGDSPGTQENIACWPARCRMPAQMPSHNASVTFGLVIALLFSADSALPQTSTPEAVQPSGMLNGTIVDDTGAAIASARVTLSPDDGRRPAVEVLSLMGLGSGFIGSSRGDASVRWFE